MCGSPRTDVNAPDTNAVMRVPTTSTSGLRRHEKTAWRCAAALLYALSMVLIPLNVLAAVAVLMAALLCLPEPRDAIWVRTGVRLGGIATALLAMTLVLAALMTTGWQDDDPSTGAIDDEVLVVSTTQGGNA